MSPARAQHGPFRAARPSGAWEPDAWRSAIRGPAAWIALAAIVLAVLGAVVPPEIHPRSLALQEALLAAVALLLALHPAIGKELAPAGAGVLFVPMAMAAVLRAAGRARALDEAVLCTALVTAGLLGMAVSGDARSRRRLLATLVVLATGAALVAILQHHWSYPQQAARLRASDPVSADTLLVRLEAGRPSGPFILPTALAGFLALVLPATARWLGGAGERGRLAWAARAAFVVQLYALLLTRSLGGLVVAAAGLSLFLLPRLPRRRATLSILLVAGVVLAAVLMVAERRAEMQQAPGGDPMSLRLGNWRAAGEMIASHPIFGVGPGAFGTFYPRFLRAGMNETRYAHNSYLQVAACWGLWIVVPLALLLARFVRRAAATMSGDADRAACAAGAATFLLHNGIDFTLYQPGIAVTAALLVGITIGGSGHEVISSGANGDRTSGSWQRRGIQMGLAGAAVVLLWHAAIPCRAASLMAAARRRAEAGDAAGAARAARRAAEVRPDDPDPQAFLAQWVLAHHMDDAAARQSGQEAAERALRLDPEQAVLHHTRALYHAAAGETGLAYREERRAHLLFPLKPEYRAFTAEGGDPPAEATGPSEPGKTP